MHRKELKLRERPTYKNHDKTPGFVDSQELLTKRYLQ